MTDDRAVILNFSDEEKARKAARARNARTRPEGSPEGVNLEDFVAFMPTHQYVFKPDGAFWAAPSVNARVPPLPDGVDDEGRPKWMPATRWLDKNAPVEQMTWSPGEPQIITDKLISGGGWFERRGCAVLNLYRPPTVIPKAGDPSPWVNHVEKLFGTACSNHIIDWCAHRVQFPQIKINHALVLGGAMGAGKDTCIEPVTSAIGPWNFSEISPRMAMGRFNGFLKSVIVRISEGRDLGDVDRYALYDHLKTYIAAPPDVLMVDTKHVPEYAIPNLVGIIITTNHKLNGLYIHPDDRRHFVAWTDLVKEDFPDGYFQGLYDWFDAGGREIVAHFLHDRDLSGFNPKTPPPQTEAFLEIVNANRASEESPLADALDTLGNPEIATLDDIACKCEPDFAAWLQDRKNSRTVAHRMDDCGYMPVRNPDTKDGLWRLHGRRQVIYGLRDRGLHDLVERSRRRSARG